VTGRPGVVVEGGPAAEDTCSRGVAYPRRMPDIPQLVAAIDSRLADIAAEISALDAAKAQLSAPRSGGHAPATTSDATAGRPRRRTASRRLTPESKPPRAITGSGAPELVTAAPDAEGAPTPKRSTRSPAVTVTRPRPGGGAVGAETLERLLADTSAGLSAKAIAAQAGAGYNRTLKLLSELEAAGEVRRSGSRRSTVWRLITDEERIAERAAELELLSGASRQRRGRARAS